MSLDGKFVRKRMGEDDSFASNAPLCVRKANPYSGFAHNRSANWNLICPQARLVAKQTTTQRAYRSEAKPMAMFESILTSIS